LSITSAAASYAAQTAPRRPPATSTEREREETRDLNRQESSQGGQRDDDAQNPQDDGPQDQRDDGPQDRRDGGPQFDRRGDRQEQRLDFLHQRLRITRAQSRAWDNFADAVRDEADIARDRFQDRREDARRGPPSVVERLERRQQQLMVQSARVDHLLRALRPLYAELNRDRRETADRLFFRPGADGGGPGRFFNRRVPGPGRFNFDGLRRRDDNRAY
jgi:hypothetical protein